MVVFIEEIGKMINKMVMVKKLILMVLCIMVFILMGKKEVMGNLFGKMEIIMKENFMKMKLLELVLIIGKMEEFIMVIGLNIKWKVLEFLFGLI